MHQTEERGDVSSIQAFCCKTFIEKTYIENNVQTNNFLYEMKEIPLEHLNQAINPLFGPLKNGLNLRSEILQSFNVT